jgi:hypothetical protein
MFCATCGNSVNPDLRYCNSCGARSGGADEPETGQMSESSFNLLVSAILAIPIAGIGIMIGLLVVMKKELGLRDELIGTISLMGFILLLVAEGGLIWLLLHRTRAPKKKKALPAETPVQLADVQMRGLNAGQPRSAQDSISSVTEHTTRTLDAVPLEREK